VKPVQGFGLGYRFEYFNPLLLKRESVYAVHNDYLAIILKMGLVGLIAFLWLFYVFFSESLQAGRRTANPYSKGLIAGFSANILQILLVGFTNHVIIGVMNTFYLAFAMGAVVVLSRNEKPREKVEISAIV
jgi:O-antigen ligase